MKDERGTVFTTRIDYVMILGKGNNTFVTLPAGRGIKKTIIEVRDEQFAEEEEDL